MNAHFEETKMQGNINPRGGVKLTQYRGNVKVVTAKLRKDGLSVVSPNSIRRRMEGMESDFAHQTSVQMSREQYKLVALERKVYSPEQAGNESILRSATRGD